MDGWVDGGVWLRLLTAIKKKGLENNGPHLSCDLHKLGANLYSKLPIAPFLCKKVWYWVGGWAPKPV